MENTREIRNENVVKGAPYKYLILAGLCWLISILCYAETPAQNNARNTYDSFDQLAAEYSQKINAESAALQIREDKFLQEYRQGLERFKAQYLQAGALEGYVEAKNLLEKFDRQRRVEAEAKQKGLAEFIKISLDSDAAFKADYQKAIFSIRTAYINKCVILKREFTKQGKIEDALSASRFLDKLNSETQQEQNSIARNELIKLFENVTSPDASTLVEVFKRNVRESGLAEAGIKHTSSQLRDEYRRRLELLAQKYQTKENIDGLLAVNKELARHNNFGELSKQDIVTVPDELKSLQQGYFQALSEAVLKLKIDIRNADKMLLASLYKAMSTDAYREDDLFKRAVDAAIEEFQNLKANSGESENLEAESHAPSTLKEGLVAYYPFNGNAKDESGNGNDGKVYGVTLVPDRFGNSGSAFDFNGAAWIEIGPVLTRYDNATLCAWIKLNPTFTGLGGIVTKTRNPDGSGTGLRIGVDTFLPNVGFNRPSPLINTSRSADSSINDEHWHYVVGVIDGTSMSLYVDGVRKDSYSFGPGSVASTGPCYIGRELSGREPRFFSGIIDDVQIYARPLTADEIQELYSMMGQLKE
ncbi:MAG: LamG domain-containing protein [Opitutae bacterium]|nr:LamG domain-containing protein [Opitutae bacterium]